jgi:hypothetical protein
MDIDLVPPYGTKEGHEVMRGKNDYVFDFLVGIDILERASVRILFMKYEASLYTPQARLCVRGRKREGRALHAATFTLINCRNSRSSDRDAS